MMTMGSSCGINHHAAAQVAALPISTRDLASKDYNITEVT